PPYRSSRAFRGKLEGVERESRRDGASDQRPGTKALGRLPPVRRHHRLWPFACQKVRSEDDALVRAERLGKAEEERRAGMEMPDFCGVTDAMPGGSFAGGEEVVDRRRMGPAAENGVVAERLAEMAAFGMRFQPEKGDDPG